MTPGKEIVTVGHSNHEESAFLELLRAGDVELLVDVRANPRSRYPQFNRSALAASLKEGGIDYVHLGEQLGGRRESRPDSLNLALPEGPFRGYADHMDTGVFADGLAHLEELAGERRTAVMCAEADWRHCHRRLVADALVVRGWRVLHLGARGGIEEHQLTEFAQLEGERLSYPAPQTSLGI
ncbi:MAG: DUF488 family protein [Solirubrobacterales bacterium]